MSLCLFTLFSSVKKKNQNRNTLAPTLLRDYSLRSPPIQRVKPDRLVLFTWKRILWSVFISPKKVNSIFINWMIFAFKFVCYLKLTCFHLLKYIFHVKLSSLETSGKMGGDAGHSILRHLNIFWPKISFVYLYWFWFVILCILGLFSNLTSSVLSSTSCASNEMYLQPEEIQ